LQNSKKTSPSLDRADRARVRTSEAKQAVQRNFADH
jgi:hypothetical protein